MPTFFRRRYMRPPAQVSTREKAIGWLILLVVALGVATCGVVATRPSAPLFEIAAENDGVSYRHEPPRTGAGASGRMPVESLSIEAENEPRLPTVELSGWSEAAEGRVYTPEDLWEKINGRADFYLAFHMVRMVFGTYVDSRDPGRFLDVYRYEMSTPDDAFGVYCAEMSRQPRFVDVGGGGYVTVGGVFFWKGGSYVRVEASDGSEELADAALKVARAVARIVLDGGRRFWADARLPQEDRVAGSFRRDATHAFGPGFLPDVFCAEYRANGVACTTFVCRAEDEPSARAAFEAYAAFFQKHGRLLKRDAREGFDLLVGEAGEVVDAVVVARHYLGGVRAVNHPALAEQRAIAFVRTLLSEGG